MTVWLPRHFEQCITCACHNPPYQNQPTTPTTPRQTETNDHQKDDRRRKKKQGLGECLGVGVDDEVRVEDVVRGREAETLGETQAPKGFVFPQHLREREKERKTKSSANIPNNQREKRTTNILADRGQVLKGANPNNNPTPETKKTIQNTQHPCQKKQTKEPHTKPTKSRRICHRRVAGPMGRPALSGETPRGTVVPKVRGTPLPRAQELASCRKRYYYPRKSGPTLSWSD